MEGSLELMGIGCSFERLKKGLELMEVNIPGGVDLRERKSFTGSWYRVFDEYA